jgi:hypothetical protein
MARIVSAIWICCAAMAARIAVADVGCRDGNSDEVYGLSTREVCMGHELVLGCGEDRQTSEELHLMFAQPFTC